MMQIIGVLLMVSAVICTLLSNKIDEDKDVKKLSIVFSVGTLLVCIIAVFSYFFQ